MHMKVVGNDCKIILTIKYCVLAEGSHVQTKAGRLS